MSDKEEVRRDEYYADMLTTTTALKQYLMDDVQRYFEPEYKKLKESNPLARDSAITSRIPGIISAIENVIGTCASGTDNPPQLEYDLGLLFKKIGSAFDLPLEQVKGRENNDEKFADFLSRYTAQVRQTFKAKRTAYETAYEGVER